MKKKNTDCPTCSLLDKERASERKRREERGESEEKSYDGVDVDDVLIDLAKYAEKKKTKDIGDIGDTIDSVLLDKLTAPVDENLFVLDDLRRNIETLSNLVMNNIGDREKILKEINAHVEMISEYRRDRMGLTEEEASIQEDDDETDDPTVH